MVGTDIKTALKRTRQDGKVKKEEIEWKSRVNETRTRERDGMDGLLMGLLLIILFHLILDVSHTHE